MCSQKDVMKVSQDLPFHNQAKPVSVAGAKINWSKNFPTFQLAFWKV